MKTIELNDVGIKYKNFRGLATEYSAEGFRSFAVILDAETSTKLEADGWNVKHAGDPDGDILAVHISNPVPPTIDGHTVSDELYEILDLLDTGLVDLKIYPYEWSVGSRSGVKAFLMELNTKEAI